MKTLHKLLPSESAEEMIKGLETVLSSLIELDKDQDYYGNELQLLEEIRIVKDVIKKLQAVPEVDQKNVTLRDQLSSEVIDEELKTYGYMGQGTDEFHEGFLDGVRFAEKAHGIGAE